MGSSVSRKIMSKQLDTSTVKTKCFAKSRQESSELSRLRLQFGTIVGWNLNKLEEMWILWNVCEWQVRVFLAIHGSVPSVHQAPSLMA